jgi:hypothetical protein
MEHHPNTIPKFVELKLFVLIGAVVYSFGDILVNRVAPCEAVRQEKHAHFVNHYEQI